MASRGVISLGPWGGSGGDRWSYKASSGITEIVLRVGGNIKSISFKDAKGLISGTFGSTGNDPNDRGEEEKIEIQWPSEYLATISGTYGVYKGLTVIISLSFLTNLTIYGPFGTNFFGDTSFSIPIADSTVVGFDGRSGYSLDALGIFVIPANSQGSISVGLWDGQGGHEFSFKVESWIKEIIVQEHVGGTNIKALTFIDGKGQQHGKFGGNDPNQNGRITRIEIDGNSEYLTSIAGIYGDYLGHEVITSLSFIANLTTYRPYGTPAHGTSLPIPIQGFVIGFHGRGGYYVDTIGIFVKPEKTA